MEILKDDERRELEALRREKKTRELMSYATEMLTKHGAPESFTSFVIGENEEDTLERIKSFSEKFAGEKREILNLKTPPVPESEILPSSRKRGIRRV